MATLLNISLSTFLESEPKIEDYENFLKKYSSVLHPNHVIFIDKKYTLAKMYGRMSGYEASDMSDEQFQRKRQLCQDVLGQWFLTFCYTLSFFKIFGHKLPKNQNFLKKINKNALKGQFLMQFLQENSVILIS